MIYACMGYIYIITTQLEEIQVLLQITSALVGSFAWCRNLQPESFLELLTSVFITNFMRESKSTIFMTVFCLHHFFMPDIIRRAFFKNTCFEGVQMSCSPPLQVDRTFAFASGDTGPPGETVAAGNLLETLGDGPQMNPNIRTLKFFFFLAGKKLILQMPEPSTDGGWKFRWFLEDYCTRRRAREGYPGPVGIGCHPRNRY